MNAAQTYLLLAQSDTIHKIGGRFRPGGYTLTWTHLAGLLAILAVLGVGLWLLARHFNLRDGQGYFSHRKLFRELCQAHDLDWASRKLLWQVGRQQRLTQPAQLFWDRRCLADARDTRAMGRHRQHLDQLAAKLFAEKRAT